MKVLCINQNWIKKVGSEPEPICGHIYTVIDCQEWYGHDYYRLEELPVWADSAHFSPLSDIDETELVNERELINS